MEIEDLMFDSDFWLVSNTTERRGSLVKTSYGVWGSPEWNEPSSDPSGSLTLIAPFEIVINNIDDYDPEDYDLEEAIKDVIKDNRSSLYDDYYAESFDEYEAEVTVIIKKGLVIVDISHGDQDENVDLEDDEPDYDYEPDFD